MREKNWRSIQKKKFLEKKISRKKILGKKFFQKNFAKKFPQKSPHPEIFGFPAQDPSGRDGINLLRNQWINDVWHDRDDLKTDW